MKELEALVTLYNAAQYAREHAETDAYSILDEAFTRIYKELPVKASADPVHVPWTLLGFARLHASRR